MTDNATPPQRPTFLTVLCILTFLSCISDLWTYSDRLWSPGVMADQAREVFEQVQENLEAQEDQSSAEVVEKFFDGFMAELTAENIRMGAIILLIYNSLCLYGAYLMWGLQKRGYYFYLAGIAVVIVAPMILIGGWLGGMTAFGGAFFSIIFALMYRSQLKYMS